MQKNQALFILILIFAALVTVFALINSKPVTINLLVYEFTASQALVIFVSAAAGAIIGILLGVTSFVKGKMAVSSLRKERDRANRKLEEAEEALKACSQQESRPMEPQPEEAAEQGGGPLE